MKHKFSNKALFLAVLLFGCIGSAMAATTGTEFQPIYNYLNGLVTGYGGKTLVIAVVIVGGFGSVARQSPMPILFAVVFAILLQYIPSIAAGILTATV